MSHPGTPSLAPAVVLGVHAIDDPIASLAPIVRLADTLGAKLELVALDTVGAARSHASWDSEEHPLDLLQEHVERVHRRLGTTRRDVRVHRLDGTPDRIESGLAARARCTDLVVFAGGGRDFGTGARERAVSAALLRATRPVLILGAEDEAAPAPAGCERVLLAWDGSTPAFGAMERALPFLADSAEIEVAHVAARGAPEPPGTPALRRWLRRHGVRERPRRIETDDAAPGAALLAHVDEHRPELLVAGAWGRSRLRQRWFGGTTRSLLDAVRVPLLLAH